MGDRKGVVKLIMGMPEGQRFLTATLFVIMALFSINVAQYWEKVRMEKEHKKEMAECSRTFLEYVLNQNAKYEKAKDKIDSIETELKMIEIWKKE